MPHVIVMVTSSYPRFPGDSVGTFMEPIARSIAARGHAVHVVAPWHPLVRRDAVEGNVQFHFYKYAPFRSLNVFGYASAMRADVTLRGAAYVAAPLALAQGWRMARRVTREQHATIVHAHWVIPGGVTGWLAAPELPLVVSLHGSDVFVAETLTPARIVARRVFGHAGAVTACSQDLAERAIRLGADASRIEVVPYGVDAERFRPNRADRGAIRSAVGVGADDLLVFAAGRLVSKKGFEYLIDATLTLPERVRAVVAIGGAGDLETELRDRAAAAGHARIKFLGNLTQDQVADYLAAADVAVVPSVRDEAGNVDGLPNVVLEALAAGVPLITTAAGGIGTVVTHEETAIVVPERDAGAICRAIVSLADAVEQRRRLGAQARAMVQRQFSWDRTAERIENAYDRALALRYGGR
jgi:glycosyltransferase involved in cell wall biosynthesis